MHTRVRRIRRWPRDAWLTTKHRLYRDYLRNPASRRRFAALRGPLTVTQREMVGALGARGIAMTDFSRMFPDVAGWEQLMGVADDFRRSAAVAAAEQSYRRGFAQAGWKEYLVRRFPPHSTLALDDPWLRVGTHPRLLEMVNAYLGMWAKLLYVDVWYTIPLAAIRSAVGSQRWHRDPEDDRVVKVFLYLSDVDRTAGPLEYVPGSCPGGPYADLWPCTSPMRECYPPPEEAVRRLADLETVTATGPEGTMVVCDTSGLHRGGLATGRARVLATWAYVTPASVWPRRFSVDWTAPPRTLSPMARFALT